MFFPYDFIYKEQLNFMLELKVSAKQSISAAACIDSFPCSEHWMQKGTGY